MNVKMQLAVCATALLIMPLAVNAGTWDSQTTTASVDQAWMSKAMSEPCMNGDVSADGLLDSSIRLSHSAGVEAN